ncbi:HipA domain-containing protein [Caballeronia sp. GAWG1-1]|uniref:HipA domain-containing protein n=1 Tax=Caballeronia sp. GAWG1-1 TaxID=2921742 RepID=UPI00202799EF|nr:HipA domain-containing protein [Caballeronia sp. GAWG1-1]
MHLTGKKMRFNLASSAEISEESGQRLRAHRLAQNLQQERRGKPRRHNDARAARYRTRRTRVARFFYPRRNGMLGLADNLDLPFELKPRSDHKEVCAVEAMYGAIATACELRMPVTAYFDLGDSMAAFGIERFDRASGIRVPMHTAAGVAHADFRVPQGDYVTLLRLTQFMTRDAREVFQAFERCVFDVVFDNRDDHWTRTAAGSFHPRTTSRLIQVRAASIKWMSAERQGP